MKIPVEWLKDYLDAMPDTEEYAKKMVMAGNAVEGIENVGSGFTDVVTAHVLTCEPHPNSDHLHVCTVDVGQGEPLQVVCGAPNVFQGARVCCALVGAQLPGDIKIKKGKIRGVESFGMLCSGTELGVSEALYPHCGDEGILLIEEDVPCGMDAHELFHMTTDVVDFEILANRPDCLSLWGIARESAAVLDAHCVLPEIAFAENGKGRFEDYAKVTVLDDENCPRYCSRVIDNVKIEPSPIWLRAYLHAAGMRPINNIVDITNFVMLETGHPMHAFDLAKVKDHTIIVRRAEQDEMLTTLDGKEHRLDPSMLVIADAERATGLAGVIGGEESEITHETKRVLFECAAFDRTNNRLTSRALGIRTEASARFEKGVCIESTMEALDRACMLVEMLACGDIVPGAFDHYPDPAPQREIDASVKRMQSLISIPVPPEEIEDILWRLGIETDIIGDDIHALVPAWRGDIEGEADLAEEVLRLHGYDDIPSTLMRGVTTVGTRGEKQLRNDKIKNALVGMGFFEALNFSFISPKWIEFLRLPEGDERLDPVVIRNPLGEDTSVMRTSLVPSMASVLAGNIRHGNAAGKLFELAPEFIKTEGEALPMQRDTLLLGMYGENTDFYALKDAVYALLQGFGIEPAIRADGDGYYHPGRKAVLSANGMDFARMGEAHPDLCAAFDIEGAKIYLAEIDVSKLQKLEKPIPPVKPLPRFPAVARDIALVMAEAEPVGYVMDTECP